MISYFKETELKSKLIAVEKVAVEEVAVENEIVNKQQPQKSKQTLQRRIIP